MADEQLTIADLIAALKASSGNDEATMKRRAEIEAEAEARLRGLTLAHPDVSVFNPKGERDFPKGDLKCPMYWIGSKLESTSVTPTELSLLNRVSRVGVFAFTRTDGSPDQVHVKGEKDADGKFEKLTFDFECKGDKRTTLPGMTNILRGVLGLGSVEDELRQRLEEQNKRIAELESIVA